MNNTTGVGASERGVAVDRRTLLKAFGGASVAGMTSLAGCNTEPSPSEKRRIILVENDLYTDGTVSTEIDNLVDKWVKDGQPRNTIEIETVNRTADPSSIRSQLDLRATEPDDDLTTTEETKAVDGLFILGDVPSWHVEGFQQYYTDLPYSLPTVELVPKSNGNGRYKEAIKENTLGWGEIAAGRYTTKALNGQTEAERTVAYLQKVNDYWDLLLRGFDKTVHNTESLVYMDPDLQRTGNKPMYQNLHQMYDRSDIMFDGGPDRSSSENSAQRFISKAKQGYEWATLGVHGSSHLQSFLNGNLSYTDYKSHDLPVRFFHLQSCQNGQYRTFGRVQINLAEVLLSQTSKTVGTVASSTSIWVGDMLHFYDAIGRGIPAGRAMGEFYRYRVDKAERSTSSGQSVSIRTDVLAPHFFGDPFLRTSWRPDVQKVYSFDPATDSDVKRDAKIAFARAGGRADDIDDEDYSRVITAKITPYESRSIEDVLVGARDSDTGGSLTVPASDGSADEERAAVAFDAPTADETALHSVWVGFPDSKASRQSDECSAAPPTNVNDCDRP
jgi:hypothetical protein